MEELYRKLKDFLEERYEDYRYSFKRFLKDLNKKIKKIKKEEAIILILIFGTALTAIIPTVRLVLKVKTPTSGVFKCYYNDDGVLVQENSADKRYKTPRPAPDGVCVFKMADNSKILQITLIGGGGGGSASQIAQKQRNIEFEPEQREIDLLADELELENPFDTEYVSDEEYTQQFLNKISLAAAGGGGGSSRNSNAISGMGAICAIKQGMLHVGDKISRYSGENGINGQDGTNGKLNYTSKFNDPLRLIAYGGKGTAHIKNDAEKNGNCSDGNYSAGYYRNESSQGEQAIKTTNQAFYNNFLVAKIVAESQKEKIKVIKGASGEAGESIVFNANKLQSTLRICKENSREKCHAYVGRGGKGGIVKSKDAFLYVDNLSGQKGSDTKFLDKVAHGGKGGNGEAKNTSYIGENELITNGQDGKGTNGLIITNSGGSCKQNECNAPNATSLGSSGGGGGLLYESSIPFQSTLVARVVDAQNRQIGTAVQFIETKEVDSTKDIRHMGNGGNGASGAIIIRW